MSSISCWQGGTSRDYSLYLSIPYCPSRCSYCSFVSQSIGGKKAQELLPRYLMALIKELRVTAEACTETPAPAAEYLPGRRYPDGAVGFPAAAADRCGEGLLSRKKTVRCQVEYTIEAGRPDTITPDKLEVIKGSGATRISINPQTFSDEVLRRIGRAHTAQDVIDCYRLARSMGFDDINMDLIAGLPGDDYEGFCRSLGNGNFPPAGKYHRPFADGQALVRPLCRHWGDGGLPAGPEDDGLCFFPADGGRIRPVLPLPAEKYRRQSGKRRLCACRATGGRTIFTSWRKSRTSWLAAAGLSRRS